MYSDATRLHLHSPYEFFNSTNSLQVTEENIYFGVEIFSHC